VLDKAHDLTYSRHSDVIGCRPYSLERKIQKVDVQSKLVWSLQNGRNCIYSTAQV